MTQTSALKDTLFLFFLSTFIFDDFYFTENSVILTLTENFDTNDHKFLLSYVLNSLNQLTGEEFYFIEKAEGTFNLKCNSSPHIFNQLKQFIMNLVHIENGI